MRQFFCNSGSIVADIFGLVTRKLNQLRLQSCNLLGWPQPAYRHLLHISAFMMLRWLAFVFDATVALKLHQGFTLLKHLPKPELLLLLRQDGALCHSGLGPILQNSFFCRNWPSKKWVIPGLFLFIFVFSNTLQFTINKCEKYPFSIQCWGLNPQPSDHESPPITTRPGPDHIQIFSE